MAQANIKAVITAEDRASATLGAFGNNVEGVASRITSALKVATVAAAALAVTGIGAATKASWDQVDAVQQATIGLNAYEKNGEKVNAVLKDLISYARSDMGVLFNRKDLFGAAQSLKIYGDNTEDLTDHVKILSRSVGLGLSTWEGLNNVIGRVGSTGKLYADDLQYLQNAGFKLDGSLSGTTQTFESLFKLLDKGIPVDALNGQANTIKGLGIRMETAFRGVGDAILGVDSETSRFVEGGLGDRLTKGFALATNTLKDFKKPAGELTKTLTDIGDSIFATAGTVVSSLTPALQDLGINIVNKLLPSIKKLISSPFVQYIGSSFVIATNLAIMALSSFVRVMSSFINLVSQSNSVLPGLVAAFIAYNVVTKLATAATVSLGVAQAALNAVMRLNPFALLVAGVVGITTAYINATTQSNSTTVATNNLKTAQDLLRTTTDAAKAAQDRLTGALLTQEGSALAVERAQLNYNNAVAQYGPKSLEAREAAYQLKQANDNLAKSNADVRDRTNEVTDAETKRAKAKDAVVKASSEVKNQVDAEANAWMGLGKSINEANAEAGKKPVYGGSTKVPQGFNIPGRAIGGPVHSGSPYVVGEKGPELFIPKSSGTVVPNNKMSSMSTIVNQPKSQPSITIQVGAFMGTQTDARKLAKMVFDSYRELKMMGSV